MSIGFTRILVPLDGSERAERAIPVAARIARAQGSELLLVYVVNPAMPFAPPFEAATYAIEMELEAASRYLRDIARRDDLAGLRVQLRVMQHPQAATALLEAVKAQQCDFVVLCSHGRSGLTRWALGSVAQKLTRHAPVPVLVLRVNEALPLPAEGESGHPAKALVALDGSALAEEALIPAAQVVAALAGSSTSSTSSGTSSTGQLHLLRVLDPSYIGTVRGERILMDQDTRQATRQNAEAYLRGVAQRLQSGEVGALGLRVTWSVVEDADPAGILLAVAENGTEIAAPSSRNRFDLLAIATHGRTGVRLWEIGSVADRVLQASTLPLLIAHMSSDRHTAEADEHSGEAKRDLEKEAGEWPGYS